MQLKKTLHIDWITVSIYFALVCIGWLNIYSASLGEIPTQFFDTSQVYTKQLIFILLCPILILFILGLDAKFYERFSSIIYLASLVSLIGLFIFGKNINGATSWYAIGSFTLQPSEFAKIATALAISKYVSDIHTDIKNFKDQLGVFLIIMIPALLILPQPDPGSALVYAAFLFPLYREGLPAWYILLGFIVAGLFIATLAFGVSWMIIALLIFIVLLFFSNRKKKPKKRLYILALLMSVGFVYSVNYIFYNVFEQRHRDRFNIVLGKKIDAKGIGYNTKQSEIAIGSGGWFGKGWTKGTQTKGNFVPEQHTDYIFSTVGEEWGFIGSLLVVFLFVFLIIRLLILAERQKSQFSRVYGYCVASILFIHFFVNIGMVLGLIPTIGIPLPFFSYGGSGLWGFTILLFIFLKLDASRL
jgi:rod shape determining protein RodA